MVAELPFAHEDTFVMSTFIVVLSLASLGRRAWPVVVAMLALTLFLPPLIPSWNTGVDTDAAVGIVLVTLAMYGFFEVIRSNRALTAARRRWPGSPPRTSGRGSPATCTTCSATR